MGIRVNNDEMVSARDLGRSYSSLVERLVSGELEKIVILKHGKMEAVLITADDYKRLLDERSGPV